MGSELIYRGVTKEPETHQLARCAKYALQDYIFGESGNRSTGSVELTIEKDFDHLSKVRANGDEELRAEIKELMDAIYKFGCVEVWMEG